jgi:hypothetical protein
MNTVLELNTDSDWWNKMPDNIKASVEKALIESENGEVTPHAEIKIRYQKWIVK